MTIGTALVIIAVLFLIDKYQLWKKAAIICAIATAVTLLSVAGYYGWAKWQQMKEQASDNSYAEVGSLKPPDWSIAAPPKDYIFDDVAFAILYPIKADQDAKTEAWTWYHNSSCAKLDSAESNRIVHGQDIFSLESYDD